MTGVADVTPGGWVSGAGHVVLVVWLISGLGLNNEPLPLEVTPISVISGEEYQALMAARTPDPATELGQEPAAPAPEEAPAVPDQVEEVVAPAPEPQPETPAEETPPPPAPEPIPAPADVTDAPPDMVAPEPFVPPPAPTEDSRPQPRPADQVAPLPTAPPPPDAEVAPEVQEAVSPDAEAEVVQEATEATAPEETTPEIVTEAERPSGAPDSALRPPSRPARPAVQAEEPAEEPVEEAVAASQNVSEDDVAAALAAAVASEPATETGGAAAQAGPPLTGAETEAFRVAVQGCWRVDPGSESSSVQVTVNFQLDRDGRVVGEVRLVRDSGGAQGAVNAAFEAARRAVLRCQTQDGYQLPADKYDQWQDVTITFDPSSMRLR